MTREVAPMIAARYCAPRRRTRMIRRARGTAMVELVLLSAVWLSACAPSDSLRSDRLGTPPPSQSGLAPSLSEDAYIIQRGDTLTVRFSTHPDHDRPDVLVRDDAKITLPLVGDVEAAGHTPRQLVDELTERYSSDLRNPIIAVNIRSQFKEEVWVGGEVLHPGIVPFYRGLMASQALVAAGGPKKTGAMNESVLFHGTSSHDYQALRIDLARVLEAGDTASDVELRPRDMLVVPKTGIAKANLWVEQYILNMLPIHIGYRAPNPASSSSSPSSSSQSSQSSHSGSGAPPPTTNP
jgi:protein involved in polysaccharide export with SLBB domain